MPFGNVFDVRANDREMIRNIIFILHDVEKILVPPGLEPGTFRVLSERDNHYTVELHAAFPGDASDYKPEHGSLLPKNTILML